MKLDTIDRKLRCKKILYVILEFVGKVQIARPVLCDGVRSGCGVAGRSLSSIDGGGGGEGTGVDAGCRICGMIEIGLDSVRELDAGLGSIGAGDALVIDLASIEGGWELCLNARDWGRLLYGDGSSTGSLPIDGSYCVLMEGE